MSTTTLTPAASGLESSISGLEEGPSSDMIAEKAPGRSKAPSPPNSLRGSVDRSPRVPRPAEKAPGSSKAPSSVLSLRGASPPSSVLSLRGSEDRSEGSGSRAASAAAAAATHEPGLHEMSANGASMKRSSSGRPATRLTPAGSTTSGKALEEEPSGDIILSMKQLAAMRRSNLEDAISEAGSDEEEVLDVDGALVLEQEDGPGMPSTSGNGAQNGWISSYDVLKADTPMARLRRKEAAARGASDAWTRVRILQEALGLAKLHGPYSAYGTHPKQPMLLPNAHFQLAKAYAECNCMQQAQDHCSAAIAAIPAGVPHGKVWKWHQEVAVMLAEVLLSAKPPKPRAALQTLCSAAGVSAVEDISDLSLRVLAVQCQSLLGTSKLEEATASHEAASALRQRAGLLQAKLDELPSRKHPEHQRLQGRLAAASRELLEEEAFGRKLAAKARAQLDAASELLMDVIEEETNRMRGKSVPNYQQHPLIQALWRQACELLFKMALVEGLAGNRKQQLVTLREIDSAEASYGCVPPSLQAKALREEGAALVATAAAVGQGEERDATLGEALEVYSRLLELQSKRFGEDDEKAQLARGEALKLTGNVYIALRQWKEAVAHFTQAADIFSTHKGPDDALVADLEHRIKEVASYLEAEEFHNFRRSVPSWWER
ncbi:hypothetical protein FOA52_013928 [Chlamydomonas sp. UWO 241]|nr:hypothetical protein FOA52_013928 [Chlamydomonas sp. UWO 241]